MPSAFDGYPPDKPIMVKCRDCRGSGNGPSAKTREGDMCDYECPTCKGAGQVSSDEQ